MNDRRIQSIVVLGGGVAGWLAAAVLARVVKREYCEIRLVEPSRPDASPSSEATNPAFHRLLGLLGIDECDLMRRTDATFSMGVEFRDWARLGGRYYHSFGAIGARLETVPFHHYWLRLRTLGEPLELDDFSTAATLTRQGRFVPATTDRSSVFSLHAHGHHLDAQLFADYCRDFALARGVIRVTRDVLDVARRASDGFVDSLRLDGGESLAGDLFIDCSGGRHPVFESSREANAEDWRHWLPCDRAVAVCSEKTDELPLVTLSTAGRHGWHWRRHLQRRVDCGYAYSSRDLSDDEAASTLLAALPTRSLTEPRQLSFSAGRPASFWMQNVIALTGHRLEPLEPIRLHLLQTAITRLLTVFPDRDFHASNAAEYNRLTTAEHESIRDFLILHYWATERDDSPFWQSCRSMEVPESLRRRRELFRASGRISLLDDEHFGEESWLSAFLGQGVTPASYDPLADLVPIDDVRRALMQMRSAIATEVGKLSTHREFIDRHVMGEPGSIR